MEGLLNHPDDTDTAKKLLNVVKRDLDACEAQLIGHRLDRENYLEVFSSALALRKAYAQMNDIYQRSLIK